MNTGFLIILVSAQIWKNIRSPFADWQIIAGQTNLFKKRSEKLFAFSRAFEKIYKLFFSGGNNSRPKMMISLPKRSPSHAFISAAEMVIWVISRFPVNGNWSWIYMGIRPVSLNFSHRLPSPNKKSKEGKKRCDTLFISPTAPGPTLIRSRFFRNSWRNISICFKAISRRSKLRVIHTTPVITHAVKPMITGTLPGGHSSFYRKFAKSIIMTHWLPEI